MVHIFIFFSFFLIKIGKKQISQGTYFCGSLPSEKDSTEKLTCGKDRKTKRGVKNRWKIFGNFIQFFFSFIVYSRIPAKGVGSLYLG